MTFIYKVLGKCLMVIYLRINSTGICFNPTFLDDRLQNSCFLTSHLWPNNKHKIHKWCERVQKKVEGYRDFNIKCRLLKDAINLHCSLYNKENKTRLTSLVKKKQNSFRGRHAKSKKKGIFE